MDNGIIGLIMVCGLILMICTVTCLMGGGSAAIGSLPNSDDSRFAGRHI